MKKIKVLQFPIANARGGITQYALKNWEFIDKSRFQFDFATRSKSLDFADELTSQGCKIHYLSCSSEENEDQFIKEMHRILDEDYDVIHLHTSYWKGYLVEKLAIERKCPIVIVHSHSTMVEIKDEEERKRTIEKHKFFRNSLPIEYATHFTACSNSAAEWLYGEQIPREQIRILNNAIDVVRYNYSSEVRKDYREKLGFQDCFVLGHVGRFAYAKNHRMLIEIFREVYHKAPNARLMLVGGGELENEVKQQVKDYGLENVVFFLGKRADVPQLLQAMDVFLLPSHFEGLGLVLIEAQAAGLKCLASKEVPREAQITPLLQYVPNAISDWVQCTLQAAKGYKRSSNAELITLAGYDLYDQIKVLEKLYSGEDISRDCPNAAIEII
ncbi:glycosyltransferase [Paenibacillus sp. sgz500958]|uniref:glycosyltransferase n=1 Tax=Paenibacillus sp. sgz500958 TaxID=3242475 RepID=UPI0036D435BC